MTKKPRITSAELADLERKREQVRILAKRCKSGYDRMVDKRYAQTWLSVAEQAMICLQELGWQPTRTPQADKEKPK